MASSNYAACLAKVLRYEGGYVNNPKDPGGETNFGITIAVARANGYAGSMRAMPLDVAKAIYRKKYWDVVNGDNLPAGLDLCVFDYAVNSGPSRALNTMSAAGTGATTERIHRYCGARLGFLQRLNTWPTFGKGWGSRVADVEATAKKMVSTASATAEQVATKTATDTTKIGGGAAAGGAVIVAGGAAAADQDWGWLGWSIAFVALIAVIGAAVYGWHWWKARQANAEIAEPAEPTDEPSKPAPSGADDIAESIAAHARARVAVAKTMVKPLRRPNKRRKKAKKRRA